MSRERRARDSNPEVLADAGFQDRCNSHSANPPRARKIVSARRRCNGAGRSVEWGMRSHFIAAVATALLSVSCGVPRTSPAPDPSLARGLAAADSLINAAVGTITAGAVLVVTKDGRVVKESAYGYSQWLDESGKRMSNPVAMQVSTIFDLASVTKVMASTYAAMLLSDRGMLDVDAPVYRYLPDFRGPRLDSITVRHLLTHSAGLVQWQPLYYSARTGAETYRVIREMPLEWGVGEGRHYSDLSFMLMGYIIERVTRQPLDVFLDSALYRPLGLRQTTFNPKAHGITNVAATEQGNVYERHMVYDSTFGYRYRGDPTSWNGWRTSVLKGEVDDGNSWYAHGGVAGHAGLFSTAREVSVLLNVLLARGTHDGRRVVSEATIDRFFTLDRYGHYLGWQYTPSLPAGSFSHTGFTGTYVVGVPSKGIGIVLLANRQQMGVNSAGYFASLTKLQDEVVKAVLGAL
jgi:serine-type D-Ala-D-Ala carboxypeptidase